MKHTLTLWANTGKEEADPEHFVVVSRSDALNVLWDHFKKPMDKELFEILSKAVELLYEGYENDNTGSAQIAFVEDEEAKLVACLTQEQKENE